MAKADFAIGAGGTTTWERCCLGLPSILVVCALNQEAIGEAIRMSGAASVLHPSDNLTNDIRNQIIEFSAETEKYLKMSNKALHINDGLGVTRVVKQIITMTERTTNG